MIPVTSAPKHGRRPRMAGRALSVVASTGPSWPRDETPGKQWQHRRALGVSTLHESNLAPNADVGVMGPLVDSGMRIASAFTGEELAGKFHLAESEPAVRDIQRRQIPHGAAFRVRLTQHLSPDFSKKQIHHRVVTTRNP